MRTHTPGPWKWSIETPSCPDWAIVTTMRGEIIANVNNETGPDIPPLVSTKMPRDANARLISSAPEMYELLKKLNDHSDFNSEIQDIINKIEGR